MSLFSLDSKFMQALSRIADLILLNLVFLVTCIPIFTIGAASTALYSVAFRLGTEREEGVFRCYFRAFRSNFKQGTIVFLVLLLPCLLLIFSVFFYSTLDGVAHFLTYLCVALLVVLTLIYGYVFPLLSQFSNSVKQTLKNALLLSIGYLPRSLVIAVLNVLPWALLYYGTLFFFQMGILWILLYFSTAAYINARILRKVFAPYQETEEENP